MPINDRSASLGRKQLMGPRLQASNVAPTQVNRRASPAPGAPRFDVCVRGDGVVGMALALALARQGLQVAWQGADAAAVSVGAHANAHTQASANASAKTAAQGPDLRAFALNAASVALLTELKVWDALPQAARTAVHDMHILGDGAGASLDFSAWSQGLRELAWIVDAADLEQTLRDALRFAPHITRVDNTASVQIGGLPGGQSGGLKSGLRSSQSSGPVNATLLAVAEGKGSASRQALGASVDVQRYGHSAVAARLSSNQLHGGLARQWFAAPEVLALLPLDRPEPGASYALVWSLPQARAEALMALEPAAFEQALAQATGGAAGVLHLQRGFQGDPRGGSHAKPHGDHHGHHQGDLPADRPGGPHAGRALWPLERSFASPWCGPGWVLLGDAAHGVHPLAGQGLNLGLADVKALADVIAQRESFRSLGDEKLLRRFERARHWPTRAMLELTDGLWHLFANTNPAAWELRNRGMTLLNTLPPLKRWLTARALRS